MRLFTLFSLFLASSTLFLEAVNESNDCNTSIEAALIIEAVADTVTVLINESVNFNVLENDIGEVYVSSVFNPVHGSISWSLNGNITYTPDEDYTGPDVFVYQIKDSQDSVASTSVFVNVGGTASTDLTVETFVECGIPEMGQYMVNIRIIGGKPPYEILVYYGDDLTNLFAEQFFLDQPMPFAYGPIFDDLKYAVAIKDSENTIVMDNKLLDYLCMSETGSTCVPETGLEMQLITTCDNGEQSDDVVATGGSGFYNYFDTPNDSFVPHTVVEDSDGCQNILFYHDIPPYTCPIAVDDVVNGAYNAPFSLKPLLNDTGEGLYISDLKDLKHGTIQWRPDGLLAYFPNDAFVGIDTLEYEISDVRGNTARATILAVVPENDEVMIFWERDCTRAEEEGVYTIGFTVAGGKPPYIIDGDFLTAGYRGEEVLSFKKIDGEDFTITAIDKDGESITIQEELIPCTFLPPPASDFSVYISCVEGEDYGILTALNPDDEPLQNSFEGNNHGDEISNGETYLAYFDLYDVSIEGTVYCPAIAVDDLYYNHPNFLEFPLTFNPLLNDEGHGLKLVDIETPNYGTVEWWEADGTMNYRSNADFQGVETFNYTIEDIGGNRTSATITIILANPINLEITYERDCFEVNNSGAENYTVNAFVSGGVPPYQVQVNEEAFFEISENGGAFNFEVPNGEGFQIYASDNGAVTHEATVDELEIDACSPFVVQVERDCNDWEEIGKYQLSVFINGGVPPYTVSGSIDTVLEQSGIVSVKRNDEMPYQISVMDSAEGVFFEDGGEIACTGEYSCSSQDILDTEKIITCACNGDLIFSLDNFEFDSPIEKVWAFWINENQEEIYLNVEGDIIPANTYFEINGVRGDGWCQRFYFNGESGISGNSSDFCNPEAYTIEAIDDFASALPGGDAIVNVLTNDTGTNLQINGISATPSCGVVVDINAETGVIVYIANADTDCSIDTFVVEVEDDCGNLAQTTVTIFIEQETEFIVQTEVDCINAEEAGVYTLYVIIQGGTAPYTISGSINEIVEEEGVIFVILEACSPYEIQVVDALGSQFNETGDGNCVHICSEIVFDTDFIVEEGFLGCTCDGSLIVSFTPLAEVEEIQSIEGFWSLDNQTYSIELGDTIPSNAYFEISEVQTDITNYQILTTDDDFLGGFTSDFCSPQTPPAPILNESESQTFLCGEGDIILSLEGGGEGTTYHWYLDAEGTIPANPPTGQVWVNDEIMGIDTVYAIAVNDTNDCQSEPLEIEVIHYEELSLENLTVIPKEPDCQEYKLTFTIVGGNGDYKVNGVPTSADFSSDWIPMSEGYNFEIDDSNDTFSCLPLVGETTAPNLYCIPIAVVDDFALVTVGEAIEINVLQNDLGAGLFISDILIDPICGEITNIDAELGIITYTPYHSTECTEDSFVYEATDLGGLTASATVTVTITNCANLQITPFFECLITETQDSIALLTYQATGGDGNYTFNGNSQNDSLQNGDIYQIEVTDGNGCMAMTSDTVDCFFTSIENAHISTPNIQLFPNPNNGNFSLSLQLQQMEEVNIEVFNALGQTKLWQRLETLPTVERKKDFNLDLSSGLYFVRVSGKDWTWTEKVVVR